MTYDKKFIDLCLELFSKIKQNRSIQECLNINAQPLASAPVQATTDPNEQIWFIYYMFFAIHNPKMEDYIQKKNRTAEHPRYHKEYVKAPPLYFNHRISIIHTCIHKPRKRLVYLPQRQRQYC